MFHIGKVSDGIGRDAVMGW